MSNAVYPSLLGQSWPITKTPAFKTIVQTSVSGKEKRIALQSYPRWTFKVQYDYLSDAGIPTDDVHTLAGFFLARQGSYDDFLFNDITDNTVSSQQFGLGDGSTTVFQLVRSYGGFVEPILGGVSGSPTIYFNGVAQSNSGYSISDHGVITFTAAPASGTVLAWSGQFYYRCRFLADETEFENVMQKWWDSKQVEFITVK